MSSDRIRRARALGRASLLSARAFARFALAITIAATAGAGGILSTPRLAHADAGTTATGAASAAGSMKAAATTTDARDQLRSMAWIAGTWSGPMWGGEFTATYTTPDAGVIIGYSELRKPNETKAPYFEFERFAIDGPALVVHPFPGGKRAVPLTLTSASGALMIATFENPTKDYPTRIVYQRMADDRLVITLSDPHGAGKKEEVFQLSRVQ